MSDNDQEIKLDEDLLELLDLTYKRPQKKKEKEHDPYSFLDEGLEPMR